MTNLKSKINSVGHISMHHLPDKEVPEIPGNPGPDELPPLNDPQNPQEKPNHKEKFKKEHLLVRKLLS